MIVNLPTDLLRSFLAVVDTGSMVKATERIFVTPSALSLQMKRLEELVQHPLFVRGGAHRLSLSPHGQEMLSYARQILDLNDQAISHLRDDAEVSLRIGVVQDYAEILLSKVLQGFSRRHPEIKLEIRTAESTTLRAAYRAGELDVALTATAEETPTARDADTVLRRCESLWIGDRRLAEEPTLALALLEGPCGFRTQALRTLEKAGKPYRIVLQTPQLNDLAAAVANGWGITCRTAQFATQCGGDILRSSLLPRLAHVGIALAARPGSVAIADLEALIREAIVRVP